MTTCVLHKELACMDEHKSHCQEFDLGKPQILLLFPIVLKNLLRLASIISIVIVAHLQGLLRQTEASHVG